MAERRQTGYQPDLAVPPGETIRETIEALGMKQTDLARRMGRDPVNVNEIINGRIALTPETAFQLESVLGVPAHFWINLQARFDETRARIERESGLQAEVDLAKKFPYADLARVGLVAATRDVTERVRNLRSYFAVDSLRFVSGVHAAAYRRSRSREGTPEALAAWLRHGEILAQKIATRPYDEAALCAALPKIRRLVGERPEVFEPRTKQICADCGVALVFLPHLPKTYAHGATKWLRPERVLVILSLRYQWADIFWFSFFHELAHILRRHSRKEVIIEFDKRCQSAEEDEADRVAAEVLIPTREWMPFVKSRRTDAAAVREFAARQGIHPGIVVGRLQHETVIGHDALNPLRVRYRWADSRN